MAETNKSASQDQSGRTRYVFDGGNFALVRFFDSTTPDKVWLFDYSKGAYLPILSPETLYNFAGASGLAESGAIINDVSRSVLSDPDDRTFHGPFLGNEYAVKRDGSLPDYPESLAAKPDRPAQGSTGVDPSTGLIYGQQRHDPEIDNRAASSIVGFFEYLKANPMDEAGGQRVDPQMLNDLLYDSDGSPSDTFKMYFNAVAYGGYSIDDVFRDIQLQQASVADPSLAGTRAVSSSLNRRSFMQTDAASKAWSNPSIVPDPQLAAKFAVASGMGGLTAIPNDYWTNNAYTQPGYEGRPSDLDEARKLDASTYDAVTAILNAKTEQEREAAKGAFELSVRKTADNLGIQLSNNALTSWNNIQSIMEGALSSGDSVRGDAQSRIERQALQSAIANRKARKSYGLEGAITDQEIARIKGTGTQEEIADLVRRLDEEDKAKGVDPSEYRSALYSLKVTGKAMDSYSMENLRKAYPMMTDDEIERYVVPTMYGKDGTALNSYQKSQADVALSQYMKSLEARQQAVDTKKVIGQQRTGSSLYSTPDTSASAFGDQATTQVQPGKVPSSATDFLDSDGKNGESYNKPPKDSPSRDYGSKVTVNKGNDTMVVPGSDIDYWTGREGWSIKK